MNDHNDDVDLVMEWLDRLDGFATALDDIAGETPTEFCDNAFDAWQSVLMIDPPPKTSSAMTIALEGLLAILRVMEVIAIDWADTPDVRNRLTREATRGQAEEYISEIVAKGRGWITTGLPSADDVEGQIAAVIQAVNDLESKVEEKDAELNAQDQEAAADQYGAILLYRDPEVSDTPIFTKVCSFTSDENTKYTKAYDRLSRMLSSDLLEHVLHEAERLLDVAIAVLKELNRPSVAITGSGATDLWKRQLQSALISFTAALQIHEYQTIRMARRTLGLDRSQVEAIKQIFADLKHDSFDYRWLEALRDALQHGDINAFNWSFEVSLESEPAVTITMDRPFMLDEFLTENRTKPWLKRKELEALDHDPNVLDMIKAVQPLMGPLQDRLDKILYPHVAEDAAIVRELIGRYEGRRGSYSLQNGPGFTRRQLAPAQTPLDPRVLSFADAYKPDANDGPANRTTSEDAAAS